MVPRRIAVVASTFAVGGAEMVTANVLRRLPRDRFDIRIYFLHEAGDIGRELFSEGFEGIEKLCRRRRDVTAALRLAQLFHSFRPGALWCLDHMDAMWLGRSAALATGVPACVVASHSTGLVDGAGHARPSFGRRERILFEFVSRVVAVSRSHARYLRDVTGLPGAHIEIIENGIDLVNWSPGNAASRAQARDEFGINVGEPVVVMVAGMRPEKAHDVLLQAVAALHERGRNLRVLLAGDGPLRPVLEDNAKALGIDGQVEFLGVRRDVARLLHACDVTVLPSRDVVETLPLSVLEAMACGAPVVASRVGSVPEVVQEGETGRLVEPGDPEGLARAIEATLDEFDTTRRCVANARANVEAHYAIERTAGRYQELFEEVMSA